MSSRTQEEILKQFEMLARSEATRDPASEIANHGPFPSDAAVTGIPLNTGETMSLDPTMAATTAGTNIRGGLTTESTNAGTGSAVGTVIKDIFESGLGLGPLIGGLFGLFGGGSETSPQAVKYQMPASISFMSADVGNALVAGDYDQLGLPRAYETLGESDPEYQESGPTNPHSNGNTPTAASGMSGRQTGSPAGGAAPQITVNVQAMDAQSFLDRSHDIAQAVRSAMLNMSSINDVVSEL